VLIDVREFEEFEQGYAKGAIHLSKGLIELHIEQAVPDPATPIICYCGGGSRSALAADNLQKMGYTNVASMSGGMKGWRNEGLPTEP
jgi:rhodanese-related sulfurtransferase